jgi:hypothetical protein
MTLTLSQFDQIYNGFLAEQNPKLSVCGQKVSEAFQINQRLNPFPFLILKSTSGELSTPTPTRPQSAGEAAGWVTRMAGKKSVGHKNACPPCNLRRSF